MGYLLKEALKTLCGVNQWAYAVFWKIACQNPKLLIWEGCYCQPLVSSKPWNTSRLGGSEIHLGEWERLTEGSAQFLIDQMMAKSHINIVGEGMIGRAAFTGNHQWVLSRSFNQDAHPPEVLNEIHSQFSAGIQTIAVIPVPSHGVVLLGSSLPIMEDMGFVNNVRSLILQLGSIPNALFSDGYGAKVGETVSLRGHQKGSSEICQLTGRMVSGQATQTLSRVENIHSSPTPSMYQNSNAPRSFEPKSGPAVEMKRPLQNQSEVCFLGGDAIPPKPNVRRGSLIPTERQGIADAINQNLFSYDSLPLRTNEAVNHQLHQRLGSVLDDPLSMISSPCFSQSEVMNPPEKDIHSSSKFKVPIFNIKSRAPSRSSCHHSEVDNQRNEDGHSLKASPSPWIHYFKKQDAGSQSAEASFQQHSSGDDLFDVLGVELKNKIMASSSHISGEKGNGIPITEDMQEDNLGLCAIPESLSEDGSFFSGMRSEDHLLDAVVSMAHSFSKQNSDDNLSCKTTLTKMSSSSIREMSGIPMPLEKVEKTFSPFNPGHTKEETDSLAPSFRGSQISSWVEQSHAAKVESSVSTCYSKKPDGDTKSNRKRLKPGENPRPRPKDRQMIQDRVKELREIVPNGAKCSIDALLEKTIKHMLFLQGVTKHADKLKDSGESKIVGKDKGLLLKDNFEGGATWAFEVGSQSMVCPIIVEDLDPPRQMLVEMLCEDRGFFLEIADMIRGLGLTILKGVMESRDDKIWARFAVEANRDVTRMEIFMSLVRLLDQTVKSGGTDSTSPLRSFPQPASIPTTCGPQ